MAGSIAERLCSFIRSDICEGKINLCCDPLDNFIEERLTKESVWTT
jgi:hypothetical protein